MTQLTFYTNPLSRGRIARWMLEETGAEYTTEVIQFGAPMHGADYKSINPMAKVPAIRHGDSVVTEVGAICTYLGEAFPKAGLAPPPGDAKRASFLRWMFFGAGPLDQATVNQDMGWTTNDPLQRGRTGYGSLGRVCRALDAHLSDGRDYILGNEFSAADVFVGSQIAWGMRLGTMAGYDAFAPYVARILARPAARRAGELDDALAAETNGS